MSESIQAQIASIRATLQIPDLDANLRAGLEQALRKLEAGIAPANTTVQSGGVNFGQGNTIGSVGDVIGGDKVAGDKIQGNKIVYGSGSEQLPAIEDLDPNDTAQVQKMFDVRRKRLNALQLQAARYGIDAPVHITLEIEQLEGEVERLRQMLRR